MSSNMNYATATETKTIDDSVLTSIYIPRVYGNIPERFIQETFEDLDLGVVSNIQCVKREGNAYMAFVHFKSWNTTNPAAVNLAKKVNDPNAQARVVYDDPWYWILLPNTSSAGTKTTTTTTEDFPTGICAQEWELMEKSRIKREKEEREREIKEEEEAFIAANILNEDEEFELLKLMVEDLQTRLYESEKKQTILQREVFNLRTILLTGDSCTDYSTPSKPTLVRQKAVFSDKVDIDMPPPNPPKLVRQNATIVETKHMMPPVPPVTPMIGGPRPLVYQPEPSIHLPDVYPAAAPSLPPIPFTVNPAHFHSAESIPTILNAIETAFKRHNITITAFNENKCKFSCHYYYSTDSVNFVVRVFSTQDEGNLIEFQRTYGDRGGFCHAYDIIGKELSCLINHSAPKSSQSNHQFKPTAPLVSKPIAFDNYMRSTIAKHLAEGDTPDHHQNVDVAWWPSEEEVKTYQQDRRVRRMEDAQIGMTKIDGMGLVYPIKDSGFWCDP